MFEEKFDQSAGGDHEALGHLLHRAARLMMRGVGQHHGPHGGQIHIVRMLAQHETMTQRELMEALQVRSSSLSELLFKLEARECITRSRDEDDRRGMLIRLTQKGRAMIEAHEQERSEHAVRLFAVLAKDEQRQLENILYKLIAAWEQDEPCEERTRRGRGRGGCHAAAAVPELGSFHRQGRGRGRL